MDKIQLLYVKNVISRKNKTTQQYLGFFIKLENIAFDKEVDVLWAGEDGVWQTLAASFHSVLHEQQEYWYAEYSADMSEQQSIPGNIQFSIRLRCNDMEFWDNNDGYNFLSQADTGVQLGSNQTLQNVDFSAHLMREQNVVPVTVAVNSGLAAEQVTIHWTTDNWLHTQQTQCRLVKNYWDKHYKSNARNPNHYGAEIWHSKLKIGNGFRLQYSISCEAKNGQQYWDNNDGHDYVCCHDKLMVLILNLHCYQEQNQDEKFTLIANAIDEQNVDIVCFQEVAEHWNEGHGDWNSNSAKIINDRLQKPMFLHTDYSHLGFDKYREGVAILSRFNMSYTDSGYVSEDQDIYSIHSRKVVMAQLDIPFIGKLNVFSAHLSWIEDGFKEQFLALSAWADRLNTDDVAGTLLCGDFNIAAGSEGYALVVEGDQYEDQYLAANSEGLFDQVFKVNDAHWKNLLTDDYRIDYIFKNKQSSLRVTSAEVVFTDNDYGTVSDHCGYLMAFER